MLVLVFVFWSGRDTRFGVWVGGFLVLGSGDGVWMICVVWVFGCGSWCLRIWFWWFGALVLSCSLWVYGGGYLLDI